MRRLCIAVLAAWCLGAGAPERLGAMGRASWSYDRDGLPGVTALARLPGGALVLGTQAGVFELDGVRATRVEAPPGVRTPYVNRRAMAVGDDGAVWIGTDGAGVLRYRDGRLDARWSPAALTASVALSVAWADGELWVGTIGAGVRVAGPRGVRSPPALERWAQQTVRAIVPDGRGALLLTTDEGRVLRARGEAVEDLGVPAAGVRHLLVDDDGALLAAAADGVYRRADGGWRSVSRRDGGAAFAGARALVRAFGRTWAASDDLDLYEVTGDALVAQGLGLAGEPAALLFDHDGVLWIGTERGLERVSDGPVRTYADGAPGRGNLIRALVGDGGDGAYLGGRDGVVTHVDGAGRTLEARALPPPRGPDGVSALLAGRGGPPWVASDSALWAWTAPAPAAIADGFSDIKALARDSAGAAYVLDRLALTRLSDRARAPLPTAPWAGMYAALSVPDGLWVAVHRGLFAPVAEAGGLALREVTPVHTAVLSVARAPEGGLWLGTLGRGLLYLANDRVRALDERDGVPDSVIAQLALDRAGDLWMCGNRGLRRARAAELAARLAGGPPVAVESFGRADGMKHPECTAEGSPTTLEAPDGRLWFATLDGVAVVDPARADTGAPSGAVIQRVLLDGAPVRPGRALTVGRDVVRLEIAFGGTSLAAPHRDRFRYRLRGFDADWVDADARRAAHYTRLPHGTRDFEVAAVGLGGALGPPAVLTLEVPPLLWERPAFKGALTLVAVAALVGLYALRTRALVRRARALEQMVEARTRALVRKDAELIAAEKMSSVATVVSGIAHELNNPLNFLVGNLPHLERYTAFLVEAARASGAAPRLSETKDLEWVARDLGELLADMAEGGRRARLIVSDLETMSPSRAWVDVDVALAVAQSMALLGPKVPPGVTLTREVGEVAGGARVAARAGQVEQVIMNLLDNALRAVGQRGSVRVTVSGTEEAVVVRVRDDGVGMSPEVARRATEPFFTTRRPGEGSGLGLAIVASLVHAHSGRLEIDSAVGQGTEARVSFPRRPVGRPA